MAAKKVYEIEINGIKESIKSVNDLKKAQEDLEKAFQDADFGSDNYRQLAGQLQDVNSKLKVIDEATSDITSAEKVEGFTRFGTAIVGVFGTATVAAQAFGASSEDIENINKKFGILISTLETFQLIQQALGRENKLFTSLVNKFTFATQAQTAATGQATIAQRIFNAVAKANPIGLIITGITILVGLFALVANNIDFLKQKFEPFFKFVSEGFEFIIGLLRDVGSFLTGGLIDDAATAKTKENLEEIGKAIKNRGKQLEEIKSIYAKQIELLQAQGKKEREIFLIKQALLIREIQLNSQLIKDAERRQLGEEKINEIKRKGFELVTDFQILQVNETKRLSEEQKKAEEERYNNAKKANEKIIKANEKLKPPKLAFDDEGARASFEALNRLSTQVKPVEVPVTIDHQNFLSNFSDAVDEIVSSPEFGGAVDAVNAAIDFGNVLFDESIKKQESQLQFLQDEISKTDEQLQASASKVQETEAKLGEARGQRREFLISQIENERLKEKALEDQKKKQVADELKRSKEIEKEKRKQANLQRGIDIAQVIAKTALAVIGFLGNPGGYPGIALSILAAVTGGFQIAAISKTDKFAMGGILKGPSHSQGGIKTQFGELEGNEIVLTKGVTSNPQLRSLASDINVAGGGRKFADGGILTPDLSPVVNSSNQMNDLISAVNKINSTPVQVEAVEVINTANRVAEIKSNASI